ncbi:hypothetical protein [Streptomyces sp. NPDC059894]|uniref:hypothetical protein n=1 Tax=unclassified Streptomyces TaxID=2593676 RepID=UPI0036615A24
MAKKKPNAVARPNQGVRPTATPSGVTHVRAFQSGQYTVVGNHLAQHRELSLTAIGLATHILSLPEGAPVDIRSLADRFPEGRDRIAFALREFDKGRYGELLQALPDLLSTAHTQIRERAEISYARLSACYSLTAQVLVKVGRYDQARLTADRASLYADLSGSPLAGRRRSCPSLKPLLDPDQYAPYAPYAPYASFASAAS